MTATELRSAGEKAYGRGWESARKLGIASRVVGRWARGEAPVPAKFQTKIASLLRSTS